MAKISKRVAARLNNAKQALQSVTTNAPSVAPAVAPLLPTLNGEDITRLIAAIASALEGATTKLNDTEHAYFNEQADDPAAIQAKDAALAEVRALITDIRGFVRTHAPERLQALGLKEDPPLAAASLLTDAQAAAHLLTKDDTTIPGPMGMSLSTAQVGQQLSQRAQTLDTTLTAVGQERRELEAALIVRDRALTQWQTVYSATCDILSGLYRLAGEEELAAKIRPTERRARGEVIVSSDGDDLPSNTIDLDANG